MICIGERRRLISVGFFSHWNIWVSRACTNAHASPGKNVHTTYRKPGTMETIKQTTRTIECIFELSVCKIPLDWSQFESASTQTVCSLFWRTEFMDLRKQKKFVATEITHPCYIFFAANEKKEVKLVHGKQQINSVSSGTNGIIFLQQILFWFVERWCNRTVSCTTLVAPSILLAQNSARKLAV